MGGEISKEEAGEVKGTLKVMVTNQTELWREMRRMVRRMDQLTDTEWTQVLLFDSDPESVRYIVTGTVIRGKTMNSLKMKAHRSGVTILAGYREYPVYNRETGEVDGVEYSGIPVMLRSDAMALNPTDDRDESSEGTEKKYSEFSSSS